MLRSVRRARIIGAGLSDHCFIGNELEPVVVRPQLNFRRPPTGSSPSGPSGTGPTDVRFPVRPVPPTP
jgi:hypothetical protein